MFFFSINLETFFFRQTNSIFFLANFLNQIKMMFIADTRSWKVINLNEPVLWKHIFFSRDSYLLRGLFLCKTVWEKLEKNTKKIRTVS